MTRLAIGPVVGGALLLASLSGARADPEHGKVVFQRCYACHSVEDGENALPGPNLRGVLGRRAGTVPGFDYSPALMEVGARRRLVWTRDTLDVFLADPQLFVPGTTMNTPPLREPAERRDVIDYLEQTGKATRSGAGASARAR